MPTASVLAIDHGAKRTGFAVTDALRVVVQPLGTYHGPGDGEGLLEHVVRMAEERDLEAILLGLPLHTWGAESERSQASRALAERLRVRLPETPVILWNEHLTTKEAEERLKEAGLHGEQRKSRRDSWSAMVLLEDWLQAGEPR